jgi:thiamine biosynthesis lipoprotein ApbE
LRGGAVGTSGAGEQFFEAGGVRYGHVIDPRTGVPASGVLAATVVAASGAVADAVSTALLVGGTDLARRYCDAHRDTLAIMVIDNGEAPEKTLEREGFSRTMLEREGLSRAMLEREGLSRAIMVGGFPGALMEMS